MAFYLKQKNSTGINFFKKNMDIEPQFILSIFFRFGVVNIIEIEWLACIVLLSKHEYQQVKIHEKNTDIFGHIRADNRNRYECICTGYRFS